MMKLRYLAPVLVVVTCAAVLAARPPNSSSSSASNSEPLQPSTLQVHPLERASSTSLRDWISQAEVVATVQVAAERPLSDALYKSETETGDGMQMIGRVVTVEVMDQLWARKASGAPEFPERFEMTALGWGVEPGSPARDLVTVGQSRLEPGNTYVIAFRWYPAECEGEEALEGRWGVIGSGGVLPLQEATLGRGEVAGAVVTAGRFSSLVPGGSVGAAVAGKSPRDLQALLTSGYQDLSKAPVDVPAGCKLG